MSKTAQSLVCFVAGRPTWVDIRPEVSINTLVLTNLSKWPSIRSETIERT
jgi:hypothetical protein